MGFLPREPRSPPRLPHDYSIAREIGAGGMGEVYRARDSRLDRDVAIKVLSDTGLGTQGRARLLHEAQALARLSRNPLEWRRDQAILTRRLFRRRRGC